jgi:gamma-glutamylcysteine synthetase
MLKSSLQDFHHLLTLQQQGAKFLTEGTLGVEIFTWRLRKSGESVGLGNPGEFGSTKIKKSTADLISIYYCLVVEPYPSEK